MNDNNQTQSDWEFEQGRGHRLIETEVEDDPWRRKFPLSRDQIWLLISFTTVVLCLTLFSNKNGTQRLKHVSSLTTIAIVGTIIIASVLGCDWHVSRARISVQYAAHSSRIIQGDIDVRIGLDAVNISLQGIVPDLIRPTVDVNERFTWSHEGEMQRNHKEALYRGLPFPVLTAVEYLMTETGFQWGRSYYKAGRCAVFILWSAFYVWLVGIVVRTVDTKRSGLLFILTGVLLLLTNIAYTTSLPKQEMKIPYNGQWLSFTYGWCYYATFFTGLVSVMFGGSTFGVQTDDKDEMHKYYCISDSDNKARFPLKTWR